MTGADDNLLERIRVKMKNLERTTDPEPVPEEFTFNNIVHGQVVKRFLSEMDAEYQYEVKFELNGTPVEVTAKMSASMMACYGDKRAALTALARALSDKLAVMLVEKIVRTEAEYQFRGTING